MKVVCKTAKNVQEQRKEQESSNRLHYMSHVLKKPSYRRSYQEKEALKQFLQTLDFFQQSWASKDNIFDKVIDSLEHCEHKHTGTPYGNEIIKEGEKGYQYFIVLAGQATVWVPEKPDEMIDRMQNWLRDKNSEEKRVHFDYVNEHGQLQT